MPVPSYASEVLKKKSTSEKAIDIESIDFKEGTHEYEVTDNSYLQLRLSIVFKLWPHIQSALVSSWSNIRSICYGLICSMLKIDLSDYRQSTQTKVKSLVLPLLMNLLSSKESESKAGGLNILGSLCGLSYDFTDGVNSQFKISDNMKFFTKNAESVSLTIWKLVFEL